MNAPRERLTADEVYARIAAINTYDNETAHATEDAIRSDVLEAIAAGDPNPHALAEAALFTRWFA